MTISGMPTPEKALAELHRGAATVVVKIGARGVHR